MAGDTDGGKDKGHQNPKDKRPELEGVRQRLKQAKASTPWQKGKDVPEVNKVEVLLLTFQHHGLRSLDQETGDVTSAFEKLKYSVKPYEIPMEDSRKSLNEKLTGFLPMKEVLESKTTLYIIYYHGHGYLNTKDGQFTIMSHNHPSSNKLCSQELPKVFDAIGKIVALDSGKERARKWKDARKDFGNLQPITEIPWKAISKTIMNAACNTLVILDCCHAGLASAMAQGQHKPDLKFRKELLGACSWGTETADRMSPALCDVLKSIPEHGAISVWTVVHEMNRLLIEEFVRKEKERRQQSVPQAVHYILGRSSADRIILKRL